MIEKLKLENEQLKKNNQRILDSENKLIKNQLQKKSSEDKRE